MTDTTEPADAGETIRQLRAENQRLRDALQAALTYLHNGRDGMALNIIRAAMKGPTP